MYSALRLGIFLASLLALVAFGARPLLAVLLAVIISFGLSFVLLRRQRDEVTRVFEQRQQARREREAKSGDRRRGSFLSRRLAEDAEAEDAEADAVARETGR